MSSKIIKTNKYKNNKFINNSNFSGASYTTPNLNTDPKIKLINNIKSGSILTQKDKTLKNTNTPQLGGALLNEIEDIKTVVEDSKFNLEGEIDNTHSYLNQQKLIYPWKNTRLKFFEDLWMKEPCFSSKDEIEENYKKRTYNKDTFAHTFYKGYYSISELPIFGWRKNPTGESKSHYLPSTVTKFLYCFFVKICGSPLYIAYLAARIIVMIGKPFILKIPVILIATINTLYLIFTVIFHIPSGFNLPINHEFISTNFTRVNRDGTTTVVDNWYPAFPSLILILFGFSIPFNVISPTDGDKYGRGEMGIFIFIVMAISAAIITLTGINVIVIMGVFIYFMFKTLISIREKALGQDLRQGTSKD